MRYKRKVSYSYRIYPLLWCLTTLLQTWCRVVLASSCITLNVNWGAASNCFCLVTTWHYYYVEHRSLIDSYCGLCVTRIEYLDGHRENSFASPTRIKRSRLQEQVLVLGLLDYESTKVQVATNLDLIIPVVSSCTSEVWVVRRTIKIWSCCSRTYRPLNLGRVRESSSSHAMRCLHHCSGLSFRRGKVKR